MRSTDVMIWVGMVVACLSISACNGGRTDHPASVLQRMLSTRLANPDACPTGITQEVQQIVNAAGSDGVAHLPEGCYRVTSAVNIPPCTHLIGAGADKTILYRDPDEFYTQSILRLSGSSDTTCTTQISGLALIGVRDTNDTNEYYGLIISNVVDFRVDHAYF